MGVVAACGGAPLTIEEFCELSRRGDTATVQLFQLTPGTPEFETQLEVVRGINDQMFSNAPAAIADVAEELGPLLTVTGADNDRVNVLLDQVTAYVEQNCPDR
jgi:hypothetical protein